MTGFSLPMDKRKILDQIIRYLENEIEALAAAAQDAREYSTDEETRAEDKYDTRATESSYLANGQGMLAAEVAESLRVYKTLEVRAFAPGELIGLTALVEINGRVGTDYYFIGPRAGGVEVELDGHQVLVITPHSPLGQILMGRCEGDAIRMPSGRDAKILRVS